MRNRVELAELKGKGDTNNCYGGIASEITYSHIVTWNECRYDLEPLMKKIIALCTKKEGESVKRTQFGLAVSALLYTNNLYPDYLR